MTRAARLRGVLATVGVLVLLALWQIVGTSAILGPSIPPPTEVLLTLIERWELLVRAAGATGLSALVGGLIGLFLGLVLAAATAWWPRSTSTVVRTAVLINAIPIVAIGPVLMSLDSRPYIPEIFAALSVLFATVITAGQGFRSASRSSRDLFAVFGTPRWTRFVGLEVPSALPLIVDAVRLAVPAALLGAILGEWFGADRGLGVVMVSSMRNIQYSQLWAAAVIAVVISLTCYGLASLLERAVSLRFGRDGTGPTSVPRLGRRVSLVMAVAVPVAIIALWQVWIVGADVPLIVAPPPLDVLLALVSDPGQFIAAAGVTLAIAVGGVAVGGVVGLLLAITVTLVPWLSAMLSPVALVIPTVPIVVFIPIVGGIFGYGVVTVLVSCVLMAFFPIYVLALTGLRSRPAGSDDLFRVYRTGRFVGLLHLALPAAVPSLLLSLRLAAASAILIAISAEWLMGQGGLGRLLSERRVDLDTAGSWAAVIVAIVLSVLAYAAASRLETSVGARWRS